ncbi:MAG TPA: PPE domain-containing protein [Nocardia sp.]|uniref:PPE domain-containing protein n=1 Tax=Nocardia sp. TaxID=1821 RepID=UPI002B4B784D|nr:PPE domain-containing protein [Nocardia sp.]HLS76883.1 PPE domain-containing protein [Nocardia sp.]
MIEPPVIGFTGVIWQARDTERLARELTTGHGVAPMAESGAAWGALAASLGAAVVEYDQIIGTIRESWRSDGTDEVLQRISQLREWLAEAAIAAGENATRVAGQVVAYEVAQRAMPHVADLAALEEMGRGIEQAGAALGSPLVAASAQLDEQRDLAKANAARVMQTYEAASTALAEPWESREPPVIASPAALEAEQASTPASRVPGGAAAVAAPGIAAFAGRTAAAPRPTAYQARTVAQSTPVPVETRPVPATTTGADQASRVPGAPLGMAPAAAAAEETRTARAAPSGRPGEGSPIEAGIEAAPAVLGAPEPRGGRAEAAP